jgi:hypothetical protein
MSQREPGTFSDQEIKELGTRLKLEHRWQWRLLDSVVRSLHDTAASFRTTTFETPPSRTELFFHQVEANPQRYLHRLLNRAAGGSPDDVFDQVLQHHDGLAQLHYHVAKLLSPTGNAEEQLRKGTARHALQGAELDAALIIAAARNARTTVAETIRRGKGADRRSGTTPRDRFVDHLLEFYCDLTGKLPGVTNNTGAERIEGPAVEFVRLALNKVGFQSASGSSLRRWIEAFREKRPDPVQKTSSD